MILARKQRREGRKDDSRPASQERGAGCHNLLLNFDEGAATPALYQLR